MTLEIKNTHLSAEALDGLLIDFHADELAAERAHLKDCAACAELVRQERAAIYAFAVGTRQQAEDAMSRLVMRPPAVPVRTAWALSGFALRPAALAGFAAAAAAVVLAVTMGTGLHDSHAAPAGPPSTSVAAVAAESDRAPLKTATTTTAASARPQNAETDEALLEGVDRELSQSVAGPLEPLSDPLETQADSGSTQQN